MRPSPAPAAGPPVRTPFLVKGAANPRPSIPNSILTYIKRLSQPIYSPVSRFFLNGAGLLHGRDAAGRARPAHAGIGRRELTGGGLHSAGGEQSFTGRSGRRVVQEVTLLSEVVHRLFG